MPFYLWLFIVDHFAHCVRVETGKQDALTLYRFLSQLFNMRGNGESDSERVTLGRE